MTELTISRTLAAPPERVWRSLTEEGELAAWFWPATWDTVASVDLRVGGRYRVSSEPVGIAVGGEYVAVEPVERLVHTWRWDGSEEETLVTITLTPTDEGTKLTIVHERFSTEDELANHVQGWADCLDRLPAHLVA